MAIQYGVAIGPVWTSNGFFCFGGPSEGNSWFPLFLCVQTSALGWPRIDRPVYAHARRLSILQQR